MPDGANLMNCHYVFALKRKSDGSIEKFKARLVADGNTQKYGVDFDRVFSTVVKTSTIRLVLIIAAARDYNLTSIDIRQAYLQAELKEDLFMRPLMRSRSRRRSTFFAQQNSCATWSRVKS